MVSAHNLDFTNVRDGGQFNKKRRPEGDYKARITKVEDKESKQGKPMWLFTIEVKDKSGTGTYPYYCVLEETQLWKLRAIFGAAGVVIPKKRVRVDRNKLVGKYIGVTLQDTEYNDKIQSEVQWAIPASEVQSDADASDIDDTEDEEEEVDEEEEEAPPAKPAPRTRTKAKPIPQPEPEEEEDGEEVEEEEEIEEEEPPPPPRRTKKAAAPVSTPASRRAAAKKPAMVDDDELEELDLEGL